MKRVRSWAFLGVRLWSKICFRSTHIAEQHMFSLSPSILAFNPLLSVLSALSWRKLTGLNIVQLLISCNIWHFSNWTIFGDIKSRNKTVCQLLPSDFSYCQLCGRDLLEVLVVYFSPYTLPFPSRESESENQTLGKLLRSCCWNI